MREPWNWTKEDLDKLIGQAESIRLEFKQSRLLEESRERIANNLTKEVSAFANTEGGTIVIGIRERREGRARIADSIDNGVDIQTWSPEQLQQLIESNVSPYLTGLRVRPIPLDETKTNFAYAIYVPPGNTAYQASDYRYYGRSEYESKALPDHEIRLRMFRGKTPNTTVRIVNCTEKEILVTHANVKEKLYTQAENFIEELSKHPDQEFPLKQLRFKVICENTGEINITEFKAMIDFSPENQFKLAPFKEAYKDGWPKSTFLRGLTGSPTSPMQVNIYPNDIYRLTDYALFLLPSK
ncbi:MAG TPA: ATP-binding protein [Anaerolineae bacterium]|jgi:hypothetical protein